MNKKIILIVYGVTNLSSLPVAFMHGNKTDLLYSVLIPCYGWLMYLLKGF